MSDELVPGSKEWIKAEQVKVESGTAREAGGNVSKWVGIGCGIPLVIIILLVLVATFSPKEAPLSEAPNRFTQTWAKEYSATTCDDWNRSMTAAQKFAAAADILTAARNKIDGATGLPANSLIEEFQTGIGNVCIVPTMTLTDATYGLYATEERFHP